MAEEEYEQATPEQKLNIATYFLMSSPSGEIEDVITDVKKLVNDPVTLNEEALVKILANYNTEQLTSAADPDGNSVLVTTYGQVSGDLFLDPNTGRVFRFDHRKRRITEVTEQKQVLKDEIAKYRSAILHLLQVTSRLTTRRANVSPLSMVQTTVLSPFVSQARMFIWAISGLVLGEVSSR